MPCSIHFAVKILKRQFKPRSKNDLQLWYYSIVWRKWEEINKNKRVQILYSQPEVYENKKYALETLLNDVTQVRGSWYC